MGHCKTENKKIVSLDFFLQEDVVSLAKELLGYALFTQIDGKLTGGIITETEGYKGPEDRACHAYNNRRTKRTEVLFHSGGKCYVYLCYGIHPLLNIVTNREEIPHAILIRGLEPTHGIDVMEQRRNKSGPLDGPGKVSLALGIHLGHNGIALSGETIWVERRDSSQKKVIAGPRVGVDFAGEDALLPWRFRYA